MSQVTGLTLEQELAVRHLTDTARGASRAQLEDLLAEAFKQLYRQQNATKEILAKHWGMLNDDG